MGVNESWEYLQEHALKILIAVGAVVAVALIAWGAYGYIRNRAVVSNQEISNAIQLYNSPLITDKQNTPLGPNQRIFATAQEKYSTAEKEFASLSHKYSGRPIGQTATYYDGLCKYNLGDAAGAIKSLESITASSQNGEIEALARLLLAEIYESQKNTAQVTKLLQQLIDQPTVTVPKVTAMMELANYYQTVNNKDAAIQLYKKIQTEFPASQVQGTVSSRLAELGGTS